MKEIPVTETITTMDREEFEQHHSRTWDYVARVGKIWEGVAEEQQAIIAGRGYRLMGYSSHKEYWTAEFAEKSGWSFGTIDNWLKAYRVKRSTPNVDVGVPQPSGATAWYDMHQIDPDQRSDFLAKYEEEIKPRLRDEGLDGIRAFRAGIKDYKGEREPVVRDVLKPEDMADLPSGEFDDFENWASRTSKLVGPIHRMQPQEVADACEKLYPEKLDRHIAWADEVAQWYAAYRDELVARQRQGIRAVK